MPYGRADLRVFCRDMGVPVSFMGLSKYPDTGEPIKALRDQSFETKLGDQGFGAIDVQVIEIRLPFDAFKPMPEPEDTIAVEGRQYVVADIGEEDDGAFTVYKLRKP